ncbi:hypothetical protein NQ315_007482 [Exocentrus adspersus]|uniref:Tc1-like transposase DDE domain-containing protein n=1 Tax=Exocentrus adspersus TaxID=1586481 RepID=A0AAV8V7H5_9CUCU|nr:hypothetical protein NQ315_007482 [Exocentrus adspersus]
MCNKTVSVRRKKYNLDETWIENDMTVKKCWQGDGIFGARGSIRNTGRLIVVHAGNENGFVPNAELVFRSGLVSRDYHGQMNKTNFQKWLTERLLPNIPPQSVIVLDNAPYHSECINKIPTKYSTKPEMLAWLTKMGIEHDDTFRKCELFGLISAYSASHPPQKEFRIDEIIRNNNHIPLQLPPYCCELNPIELAWAQTKQFVRELNPTGELTIANMISLTQQALASISSKHWQSFVNHVIKIENKFWETDARLEDCVDQFVINVGDAESDDSSDNSDCSFDSHSSTDSSEGE